MRIKYTKIGKDGKVIDERQYICREVITCDEITYYNHRKLGTIVAYKHQGKLMQIIVKDHNGKEVHREKAPGDLYPS